jgi:uncharacterized protein YwbE
MVNKYIKPEIVKLGHPSLEKIRKGTVSKILSQSDVKPHKISYYLEKIILNPSKMLFAPFVRVVEFHQIHSR